ALAARIGEEILYYHHGELAEASSREAFEMGIYGAWMPPHVYAILQSGEETTVMEQRRLIDRPYLIACRGLRPTGTMAVPVSLAAREAAVRQRELAHIVMFTALMGGLLSLALSVLVARALARPIGQHRRAALAVGAGHLRSRLPEQRTDELGELFNILNRIVRDGAPGRTRDQEPAHADQTLRAAPPPCVRGWAPGLRDHPREQRGPDPRGDRSADRDRACVLAVRRASGGGRAAGGGGRGNGHPRGADPLSRRRQRD